MFLDAVREANGRVGTQICIGIDPDWSSLPRWMTDGQEASRLSVLRRAMELWIDSAGRKVPAAKFQMAFFEEYGAEGWSLLEAMVARARSRGLLVILDGKRGDVGSTMRAYAAMAFDRLEADALTLAPYMGVDALMVMEPWLKKGRGAYVLLATSNPSGRVFQTSGVGAQTICDVVLREWTRAADSMQCSQSLGWVVGAGQIASIHSYLKDGLRPGMALLSPGVGAQGAPVTDALRVAFSKSPASLLPISRGITGEFSPEFDRVESREEKSRSKTWTTYAEDLHFRIERARSLLTPSK